MTGKVKPGMTGKSLGREGLGASGLARTWRSSWKGPGVFQDGNDGKVGELQPESTFTKLLLSHIP